ncbi:hypothetical protein K469DRAFT_710809 [Zopfia rhizophila CBS 207.26]|uniref:Uncharacterized protein n=1 Tax=Zopfia rhizophila CBS 207.26 TaxID=1314779 RepID=A0A6A6DYC6_9PEZI|nr:hypothetical protein K469DRAFT_710809 [Zopfia rhizophila CBS 207.26]
MNANRVMQLTACDGTNASAKWCCGATNACRTGDNHNAVSSATAISSRPSSSGTGSSFISSPTISNPTRGL